MNGKTKRLVEATVDKSKPTRGGSKMSKTQRMILIGSIGFVVGYVGYHLVRVARK